jgi:CPA2 family monovalent cation:H+ antiporter-2
VPFNPYLIDVLILLLAAIVVVSLFRALKISSIVGYLIAGLCIGPHALGFITDTERMQIISEFGVVFLLFTIGLKMPMRRFRVLGRYVFGLGAAQVVLTTLVFTAISYGLHLPLYASILIGSGLALSSTAVGLQIITEQGELSQKYGRVSFGILLSQDLAVVVLLTLLSILVKPEQSVPITLGTAAFKASVVLILIILTGRFLLRPFYRVIASLKNTELFIAVTVFVVLATSLMTDYVGLSKELGAFLAGLILAETEYRHQVEADIQPFYGILLGLFFMSVGMTIDVRLLFTHASTILAILLGMLLIKGVIIFILCRLFHVPSYTALRSSLLLAAGGEFVFVLLIPAVEQNLVTTNIAQIIYLTIAISMALTPFLASLGKYISDKLLLSVSDRSLATSQHEIEDLSKHVIVAGFGRVGKIICRMLSERMVPFVAIDNDMNRVSEGRARGLPVFYGDATRDNVIKSLGADKAIAAVVSLHNPRASLKSALMIRRKFPHLLTVVRLEDNLYEKKLIQAGAMVVKPEHLEPSLELASTILRAVGTHERDISQILDSFRRAYILDDFEQNER